MPYHSVGVQVADERRLLAAKRKALRSAVSGIRERETARILDDAKVPPPLPSPHPTLPNPAVLPPIVICKLSSSQ